MLYGACLYYSLYILLPVRPRGALIGTEGYTACHGSVRSLSSMDALPQSIQRTSQPTPPTTTTATTVVVVVEDEQQIDSGLSMDNILDSPEGNVKRGKFERKESFIRRVEKDAADACVWLRAAGFPQYVQIYEEGQFPINLSVTQVERDHSFLDQAAIDALFRRLNVLNRCADLMTEKIRKDDDSDDEDQRALSENWKYQKKSGRWSRRILPKDKDESTDSQHRLSNPDVVIAELRRSLGELREDSLIRSFEFTEEFFDSQPTPTSSSPPQPTMRPRSLSASQEGEMKCNEAKSRISTGSLSTAPELQHASRRRRKVTPDNSPRPLWPISRASPQGPSNSFAYGADSPGSGKRAPAPYSFASPLVQVSCRSNSISVVSETKRTSASSLRSPSPVLVKGRFFSQLESSSIDSILDEITSNATKGISRLKQEHTGNNHSRQNSSLLEPPVSSEGGSSSLDLSDSLYDESELQAEDAGSFDGRRLDSGDLSSTVASMQGSVHLELDSSWKGTPRDQGQRVANRMPSRGPWHSFKKSNSSYDNIKSCRTHLPIDELSVGQFSVIRKLCLLRLTAMLEMYNPNNKIGPSLGKLLNQKQKTVKAATWKDSCVFGVPLIHNVQTSAHPLPGVILRAMDYIRENGMEVEGVFRKAGNAARVLVLEETIDRNPDFENFAKYTIHDIAAMIKAYLRRLPEPLIGHRVCDALIHIMDFVPSAMRLQAMQTLFILLPCQNRLALQALLLFLQEIVDNASTNQMDADNLAVCMTQSLFALPSSFKGQNPPPLRRTGSFRRHHDVKYTPQEFATRKEITDSLTANKCLAYMIEEVNQLFMVSTDMLQVCKFSYLEVGVPLPYTELGQDKYGFGDYRSYVEGCVAVMMKEHRQKFRNWVTFDCACGLDVSWQKVDDGLALRLWRGSVDVQVPAHQVFKRLWAEQHLWDPTLEKRRVVAEPDMHTQIYQYSTFAAPLQASRDYCVLRSWRYVEPGGLFLIASTSVTHPVAEQLGSIRATVLAARYLIEPLEPGLTRLTFIGRFDLKGVCAEYYKTGLGAYICTHLLNVKKSFASRKSSSPDFQETPV